MIKSCPHCGKSILYQVLKHMEVPYNSKGEQVNNCPYCSGKVEVFTRK